MLNTWDRADIMKIIPTWPRASLPWFHQTAPQDCSGLKSNPEEPFSETKGSITLGWVGIIFIIYVNI